METGKENVHIEFDFDLEIIREYARKRFGRILFTPRQSSSYSSSSNPLSDEELKVRKEVESRVLDVILKLDIEAAVLGVARSIMRKEVADIVSQSIRREVKGKLKELRSSGELFSKIDDGLVEVNRGGKEKVAEIHSHLLELLNEENFLHDGQGISEAMRELGRVIDEL